jgi:hypothetical protein
VNVRVRPFQPGSFDIHTILSSGTPSGLFATGTLTAVGIFTTLRKIGLVAKTAQSVLDVIERIKGKPTKIEKTREGYRIHGESGASANVNHDIGQLIQNQNVTQNTYNISLAIERGSSRTIKTYIPQIPNSEVTVTAAELLALKEAASSGEIPSTDERVNERTISQAIIHPKRGSFDRDGSQWSFKWESRLLPPQ